LILISLWLYTKDTLGAAMLYFSIQWLWLSIIAWKTVQHPLSNKFGRSFTIVNMLFSFLIISSVCAIMLLSISFLFRMVFGQAHIYWILVYIVPFLFVASATADIYIIVKNLKSIDNKADITLNSLKLILFPVGIWTVQETLKQKI
jgi:hypothetical protein